MPLRLGKRRWPHDTRQSAESSDVGELTCQYLPMSLFAIASMRALSRAMMRLPVVVISCLRYLGSRS